MSVNKVTLIGRLGKDPEVREGSGGVKICKFSIATDRGGAKGDGKSETDWHNIVCFGKTAEICERFLQKGRQVYVEGRIEYSQSEKDGVVRYYTNIVCNTVEFLGSAPEGSSDRQPSAGARQTRSAPTVDDDIPF